MALESATYINQLDQNAPDGLDRKSEGDDHMRMIKRTLKNSFPGVTGPVNATQDQLNALLIPGLIPIRGMITMWYGDRATIPAGWILCDGTNGTPNLLNRFPMGAGAPNIIQGVSGGTADHTHTATTTVTVAAHALTIAEMPRHSHGMDEGRGEEDSRNMNVKGGMVKGFEDRTLEEGGGLAHGHPNSAGTTVVEKAAHLPPFVTVWFIMKS